ncbi:YqcI/YcgG family protein [Peribacillus sp. SCS-37]|uniref:YqcI/YcgG family protein n=1 Tax=Paraperibacillus esterisolvens TaxID=3115296 RepID=UPI0039065ED9
MKHLYEEIPSHRELLDLWEKDALDTFSTKMKSRENPFPCIPATIGFSFNHLRYGFVSDPRRKESGAEAACLMREYTENSRDFGNYTSLILFYETPRDLKEGYTIEQFEDLFWQQLNHLNDHDEKKWPGHIPDSPHNPIWEFCFHGEQYFMYCGTPAHINRQSRHFDYFMLAITPRWVLQEFMKNETFSARIKKQVRSRLADYDSVPIHPDLKTYGSGDNYEWKQYFLRDDASAPPQCPFHRVIKASKE